MKKILIFRQASLGDFIVGIPAIKIIKKKFPNYKIYYLTNRQTKQGAVNANTILNKNKLINKFIYIDEKDTSFIGLIKLIIKLKKYKFSNFFYLNQTEHVSKFIILRNLLFFSFCKIKKMRGFNLLIYKPNYMEGNESFHLAKRVDPNIKLEAVHKVINSSYKINKHSQNLTLKKFLQKKNIKRFITISHGQRNSVKDWGLENWKVLLKSITYHYPSLSVIIVGTKVEYQRAKKLQKIKPTIINLCGKSNIQELIEIIHKSKFHISHDDGTMHVASMFNKKSIAIFSNYLERGRWFPTNSNSIVFYPKISIKKTSPDKILKIFKKKFF